MMSAVGVLSDRFLICYLIGYLIPDGLSDMLSEELSCALSTTNLKPLLFLLLIWICLHFFSTQVNIISYLNGYVNVLLKKNLCKNHLKIIEQIVNTLNILKRISLLVQL